MMRLNLQQFASSADYWRKREERNLKSNLKQEAEYDKEIERIYKDMLDAAQKEIDAFFGKYADAEGITLAEAKKRVSQLDIEAYERKAKKYVDAASKGKYGVAFSKQANEEMRLYNLTMKVNRLEMLKANIGLELIKGHAELEAFMSEILKGRTQEELERQAGILGKSIKNNAKLADTIVNASFKNATFSDRLWMYHDQMKADLSKLLQSGMIQGKNSRQLAKDLRKYYYGPEYLKNGKKGAVYNTERLMRTELARVQTEAQKQAYIKEGTEEYKFMALGDACDVCMAINGKSFKVKDMMPGENAPPMHPHCRCTTVSDDSKGREELDALLDFVSKGGTEADWNKFGKAAWLKSGRVGEKRQTGGKHYVPLYSDDKKDVAAAKEYSNISRVNDIKTIARNTGFSEEDIKKIKRHIFFDKHKKYDGYGMLDADYDIAVAWNRLRSGKFEDRDITLLKHELLESELEQMYNLTISEAHKMAKEKYDWEKELIEAVGEGGEKDGLL